MSAFPHSHYQEVCGLRRRDKWASGKSLCIADTAPLSSADQRCVLWLHLFFISWC